MYAQQQQHQQPYSVHMGPDGASQQSMASRHAVLLSGLASARTRYAGQNNTSTTSSSGLQVPATIVNGTGPSVLEGRDGYGSTLQGLTNYTSADYPAATASANGTRPYVLEGRSGYGSTTDYPAAITANGTGPSVLEGRRMTDYPAAITANGTGPSVLEGRRMTDYPAAITANRTGPSVLEGRSGYGPTSQGLPSYTSAGYTAATTPNGPRSSALEGQSGYDSTFQGLPSYTSTVHPADNTANRTGPSALEGRSVYGSTLQGLPSYTSAGYPDKPTDHPLGNRPLYAERPSSFSRRELQNESTVRPLQFASPDRSSRQGNYLAPRTAVVRHAGPEFLPYGGRMDADRQTLSIISSKEHAPSILRADPRRDVENIVHAYSSGSYGHGVSLPPGRAYALGRGLHGTPLDSVHPGGILVRSGYARVDDRLADMEYAREIERREEIRHLQILRDRERERERQREQERERGRGGLSSANTGRYPNRESPHVEASHRRHSPVQDRRREYVSKGLPNRARKDLNFSLDTPIRVKTAKKITDASKKAIMVKQGRVKKKVGKGKGKKAAGNSTANPNPNSEPKPDSKVNKTSEDKCHHCDMTGHWKRNCPQYLEELKKNKASVANFEPKPNKKVKKTSEDKCHHCDMTGHWKRSCPQYLEELKKNKASTATTSGVETEKGQASK